MTHLMFGMLLDRIAERAEGAGWHFAMCSIGRASTPEQIRIAGLDFPHGFGHSSQPKILYSPSRDSHGENRFVLFLEQRVPVR
jgi:hypothetical protein